MFRHPASKRPSTVCNQATFFSQRQSSPSSRSFLSISHRGNVTRHDSVAENSVLKKVETNAYLRARERGMVVAGYTRDEPMPELQTARSYLAELIDGIGSSKDARELINSKHYHDVITAIRHDLYVNPLSDPDDLQFDTQYVIHCRYAFPPAPRM